MKLLWIFFSLLTFYLDFLCSICFESGLFFLYKLPKPVCSLYTQFEGWNVVSHTFLFVTWADGSGWRRQTSTEALPSQNIWALLFWNFVKYPVPVFLHPVGSCILFLCARGGDEGEESIRILNYLIIKINHFNWD